MARTSFFLKFIVVLYLYTLDSCCGEGPQAAVARLRIEPSWQVREGEEVSFVCEVADEAGNLRQLTWFHFITPTERGWGKLEECNDNDQLQSCVAGNGILLYKNVTRADQGYYSCEAKVEDVHVETSAKIEFLLQYRPGLATITYTPKEVISNGEVTLSCSVKDMGRPKSTIFKWKRGNDIVFDVTTANWTIKPVDFTSRTNFTCFGVNSVGGGGSATTHVDILHPPGPATLIYTPEQVIRNRQVTLSCSVKDKGGAENITYRWKQDNDIVHDVIGANWTIKPVNFASGSKFTCFGVNLAGIGHPATTVVNVLERPVPQLRRDPPSLVREGDSVKFVCEEMDEAGNLIPVRAAEITWPRKNRRKESLLSCKHKRPYCWLAPGTLLIRNVTFSDQGKYSCKAADLEDEDGPSSAKVELVVSYPPGPATLTYVPFRITRSGITMRGKRGLTLSCIVKDTGGPDNIIFKWQRGNDLVPGVTTSDWDIEKIDFPTGTNFSCFGSNLAGNGKSATVSIKVLKSFVPQVRQDPPSPVREGDNVTFTCEEMDEAGNVSPNGKAIFYYLSEDTILMDGCDETEDSYCKKDPSTLLIRNVKREHQAKYTCSSEILRHGWGPLSEELDLVVLYPPGPATLVSMPKHVIKNGEVTLNCNVDDMSGAKNITYMWKRGNEIVPNVTAANWTIKPVDFPSGTNFTCFGVNSEGNGKPQTVSLKVLATLVPQLRQDPPSPVREGDNVTFTCEEIDDAGNLSPGSRVSFNFPKNVELVKKYCKNNHTIHTCWLNSSSVLIRKVKRFDQGKYICGLVLADNQYGPKSAVTNLAVLYPPGPATLVHSPKKVVKNGEVTLSCRVDDIGGAENITFKWKRGNEIVPDVKTANWTIKSVDFASRTNFTCFGVNSVGTGEPATITLKVLATLVPQLRQDPPSPVRKGNSVTFTCEDIEYAGNPSPVSLFRFYFPRNAQSNEKLTACDEGKGNFCHRRPSTVLIKNLTRIYQGEYSCQAEIEAGSFGPNSTKAELIVLYPPGPAELTHMPKTVVKNGEVTLNCRVDDMGGARNITYMWRRNNDIVPGVVTANWTIRPVNFASGTNFTCFGVNSAGNGEPAIIRTLKVLDANKTKETMPRQQQNCVWSKTVTDNRKSVCKSSVIFYDDFRKFDPKKWMHEVKIAGKPDFEFATYDSKPENSFVRSGILHIKPTVISEDLVDNGEIKLDSCTGYDFEDECSRGTEHNILPPVQSARLTTRQSLNFKYGVIEIQAKFPQGDWIAAGIQLVPTKTDVYGPYYESGLVQIISRGNLNLKNSKGEDIGRQMVEGSVLLGYGTNVKSKSVHFRKKNGWRSQFHNISIIWTPDNIVFMVDGHQRRDIIPKARGSRLSDIIGLPSNDIKLWNKGTSLAPFDQPFYLRLGVSVGGVRDFDDNLKNDGKQKPWSNADPMGMINFWKQRKEWKRTWHGGSTFLIKSVKVSAL